ncbi:MAG: hypothetical protein R3F14_26215 [Polyangiaceae bacterium]
MLTDPESMVTAVVLVLELCAVYPDGKLMVALALVLKAEICCVLHDRLPVVPLRELLLFESGHFAVELITVLPCTIWIGLKVMRGTDCVHDTLPFPLTPLEPKVGSCILTVQKMVAELGFVA